jgi:hypothetical protein
MPVRRDGVASSQHTRQQIYYCQASIKFCQRNQSLDLAGFTPQLQRTEPRRLCHGSKQMKKHEKKMRAPNMKKFGFAAGAARAATFTSVLAGGLTAAVLGLAAPAGAAPTGPGNAQETINQLQADGYNVVVNRIGTTPLDQAAVVAVRPGQTYSRTDSGTPGDSLETTVTGKTIYVDVK